jgi:alpha-galactosidase
MRDALLATGRPIFYSICSWGTDEVAQWGNVTGNSWRTTQDIANIWISVKSNILENSRRPQSAGPGGWNDPDMLEVGVTKGKGLSLTEEATHFALWAFARAPLIIGADLTIIKPEQLSILSNPYLIKLN